MTKAHKATNQAQFLLRRKLAVQGLTDIQWKDFIEELNHHPCVDFAERKSESQLIVTFDATHWSTDALIELVGSHGGHLKGGWWERRKLAGYRFGDENLRANANLDPFCCSKIPPMKK
ncbi:MULTISPECIES: hypothetical protein [unclassified Marinobacter]|uniref:hypothetical protein n=1 Tax=unclassified Marinobacter TaxID=83889 RepID=UPI000BF5BD20|nr:MULTISPECIES: hypothetical protein [unclassified Marinobacter]PFG08670.1 hypothetical protein ATI45_0973 [Marinobacter sp. LV10MA510-1]PFG54502.1 hypothetical protein ATG98_3762 [Marinobacter sp. LV10R520-4]